MEGIEYIFGLGDGDVETWTTPPGLDLDGDGALDAVALDFDGDGLYDDALWDGDGDGVADRAVLDVGPDGRPWAEAEWHSDPGGDGTWSGHGIGGLDPPSLVPPPASEPESALLPPAVESTAPPPASEEAPQRASPAVVAGPSPAIAVDTDGDGALDTDLTDADGDGLLDTATAAGSAPPADGWWGWAGPPR